MPEMFIHRFVPGRKEGPVLLLLHGTGGTEDDLLTLGRTLDPQAPLLSPRGKILENGMPRFFRRLAEGVFDEEDLIFRTHELADFVALAREKYEITGRDIVAVGYSNGANIAASLMLLRPEVLRGGVLFRAMVPLIPATLPDLSAVRVFLAAGRHDSMIAPANTQKLAALLQRAGAGVSLHWTEGGHELHQPEIEDAAGWIQEHFPPK